MMDKLAKVAYGRTLTKSQRERLRVVMAFAKANVDEINEATGKRLMEADVVVLARKLGFTEDEV